MSLKNRIKKLEEITFPSPEIKYKVITLHGEEEFNREDHPDIDENTRVILVHIQVIPAPDCSCINPEELTTIKNT